MADKPDEKAMAGPIRTVPMFLCHGLYRII
jgi:hypothetical protein